MGTTASECHPGAPASHQVAVRKPTPQQEVIYESIRSGQSHCVIEALAGTGKTTTAVGCLNQGLSGRVGFVAFNAHIAEELRSRLPPSVPAMTLHSLGLSAVRRALPDVTTDEAKLGKLSRALSPDVYPSVRIAAEQLTRLCKYTLTVPSEDTLTSLADHYGVEVDDRDRSKVYSLATRLISECATQLHTIDFDDMVWLPSRLGLSIDQFDLLLVDEAQDLNAAQQQLALDATRSGRLAPIGDRNQAIYGFSGADCEGLQTLGDTLSEQGRGCRTLPLTVTWRCPASHVELARRIVPTLEAAPGAADGEVSVMGIRQIREAVRPGDLVICRKNAPVVSLTYHLALAGIPAVMRGRDIGKGLLGLVARLKPQSISDLVERIEDYREREEARLRRKNAPSSQLESLADRCDCLSQLSAQAASLESLEDFIRRVFDDAAKPGQAVVLSSVHRAKGLESDTVYVLDTDSLPLIRRDSKPWQRIQERNLCYIAATRSKRTLVFEERIPAILTRSQALKEIA